MKSRSAAKGNLPRSKAVREDLDQSAAEFWGRRVFEMFTTLDAKGIRAPAIFDGDDREQHVRRVAGIVVDGVRRAALKGGARPCSSTRDLRISGPTRPAA